ncbi:MAG: cupredoxin domain-containing protein [Thaumarchaeota archaeon]|nr:cupredoxin domain-containing protein [Nitrososphaerota archaeon]
MVRPVEERAGISTAVIAIVVVAVLVVGAVGYYSFFPSTQGGNTPSKSTSTTTSSLSPATFSTATSQTSSGSTSSTFVISSSTTSISSISSSISSTQTIQTVLVVMPSGAGVPPNGSPPTYGYVPGVITLVIGVNNTVKWVNNDTVTHTVSVYSGSFFDSGDMKPGSTFTFTFTQPGTVLYSCIYHGFMQGKVIVKAPP